MPSSSPPANPIPEHADPTKYNKHVRNVKLTRKVFKDGYISSACWRSRIVRCLWGAARSKTSTIACICRDGLTLVDGPRHAGQFVPPFCEIMKESVRVFSTSVYARHCC